VDCRKLEYLRVRFVTAKKTLSNINLLLDDNVIKKKLFDVVSFNGILFKTQKKQNSLYEITHND